MGEMIIEKARFPRLVVVGRRERRSFAEMGRQIGALYGEAEARRLRPAGAPFVVYFEKPVGTQSVDYGLYLPVTGSATATEGLEEIGGEECYRVVWKGPYKGLAAVYEALSARVEAEGRSLVAPPREVYGRGPLLGFLPFGLLTEIWYPIEAAKAE